MSPLLSVTSLTTSLHSGVAIVDDISFGIRQGETLALLGESGCGKSMTALSLMRLLPDGVRIAGGSMQLGGVEVAALPEREMRAVRGGKMAMIFQEPGLSLNPVMTVGAQIAEVLELHQSNFISPPKIQLSQQEISPPETISQRCVELLTQVGIPDPQRRLGEYPFQLSGGMKQRVMIAMALAGRPQLLIADEPTTALDVTIQAQVLQLLRDTQKQQGMAMLLITHDLGVVAENAHQVAVMYAGQIVEMASREQLFNAPAHPYTQKLFAAQPDGKRDRQALAAIAGNVPALGQGVGGCRFASRCTQAWALCHEQVPAWVEISSGQGVRCHLYGDVAKQDPAAQSNASLTHNPASGSDENSEPSVPPTLLQVTDLQIYFPIRKGLLQRTVGQVKAVDGVSLEIAAGKTFALVGESGCGKTTVGKALLQLIKPTAGAVRFAGHELTGLSSRDLRAYRSGMQMVFQDPFASLNPKMRVAEILQEGMDALNIGHDQAARQKRIDELLDQVGLVRTAKWRYPHEFSGGQRQRIAIARALAVNPKLLICDEPTSALDVSVQAQILNLISTLQKELGLSYLFITHNLAVVDYLAHEVCVMYLGRIVERGSVEDVLRSPRHPYTQALLSAVPHIKKNSGRQLIRLSGEMPSPANPPQGCHFHPRCKQAIEICRSSYPQESILEASTENTVAHRVHCHLLG
ncbi:MAG: ABC transporter ATP-binding protein [Gallionellaceae bacterium]|jgi:peptide/nickel transport system ATP-binding protein